MVGSSHEALHRIFQKDPALLTRTLQQVLHVPFPEPYDFAGMNVDLTEIEPIERRVDTLLRAETREGSYLLVVESQGKPDDRKRGSWPYYLGYLREKYRCEPVLIVVTQSRATARWAAEPIHVGVPARPSMTVWPFVLGPDNVPVIATEREAKQDPPLAALSAMTHGRGRQAPAILESLEAALRTIDRDSAAVLAQFVDSCLADPQARQMWRDMMTAMQYFWRHPLAEEVREEGREEGRIEDRAEMTLRILELRGIPVPDAVRERVESCTDLEKLTVWSERAVHAATAEDLFDGERP
ncbi:hypothetical protein [Streptomyces aurantiogriseus]|uniref:Transposase (putative) YhgA-like domain-containing protein n=1 Tax=Streptomyces aurantiogriseus TaxID=66870 RepID=A0A918FNL1_9ACTN|nr:hypothetical protein [Streptomyces aurantiogriseus]GGR60175.1 hypothetical protein GCM10010251_91090 [Streptomyces aurantiogriseus]